MVREKNKKTIQPHIFNIHVNHVLTGTFKATKASLEQRAAHVKLKSTMIHQEKKKL
jgi:hypothetical protein